METVRQRHKSPRREVEAKPQAAAKDVEAPAEDKKAAALSSPKRSATRRRCCSYGCVKVVVLTTLFVLLGVGLGVSYIVSRSPKELDEQLEDVQSYVQWWWATMRDEVPPCTYNGVRHYSWGGAVDDPATCGCHLRRCPPAPVPKEASAAAASSQFPRGEVSVQRSKTRVPTVESLWATCEAVHSPVTRDPAIDPLRTFDAPEFAVADGIFANVLSPMCVQSGRVYAALRPNSSLLTITYHTGLREFFYTNLTDVVLQRGAKYHPITTVPAAGLLLSNEGQAGNLFTLIQEGLRAWAGLMEAGFGLGFTSEEDKRVWHDVPKQVVFLSDPSMDIPQETKHSSNVARQLANAFTTPTGAPYFAIAPLSRTRPGETAREPMYCFCGGFMIPSIGTIDFNMAVSEVGYRYLRHTVNAHFGLAELGTADVAAVEAARTGSALYTPEVRAAWPPRAVEAPRRPRLLWIRRRRPRIAEEAAYTAMARAVGFEVLEDPTYVTKASAARQVYLARYADVIAGFHGVSLINAVWMDTTARRQCRTLLEFLPYVNVTQVTQVYGAPVMAAGVRYTPMAPTDLEFTGGAFDTPEKQETARRELMGEGPKGKYAVGHPAFSRHRAIYDPVAVQAQLKELYAQLMECL